jgi:hypothetical protein
MGCCDSSRTRVAPVFSRLQCIDPTGRSWLRELMRLPTGLGREPLRILLSSIEAALWWPNEVKLAPPSSLLHWLVDNMTAPRDDVDWGRGVTRTKREALVQRDAATIQEAKVRLARPATLVGRHDWAVLEGSSQPDVFLQTSDLIVVIEGKRTESGPTIGTTWVPSRHQMLRHLDAAWQVRETRAVYGFFIVEEDPREPGKVPKAWVEFADATISASALRGSLPHRTDAERQAIATGFLGVTTWQSVCARLKIPEAVLIEEVISDGS